MTQPQERHDNVAAAFRAGAVSYGAMGSPLYSALCASGADNPELVALAAQAMPGSQPVFHLLASVHHVLMRETQDPLARYFATLTDTPSPPDAEAGAALARFCREHHDEIATMLANRTVQTTYAERCVPLVAPIAWVADTIGEPLHLIEIGCSAGVLLTFDRYAYLFGDRDRVGAADAPLTLSGEMTGDPPLRLPRIASRTGLDIHPVDVRIEDERRWLIAQTFPEFREQRARLSIALGVVAASGISMRAGDALSVLPAVLEEKPDPICIFHSACLYYWSDDAKAALDAMLMAASRQREIYRVGVEGSARFVATHKGQSAQARQGPSGEITIARYSKGGMDSRAVADTTFAGPIEWRGWANSPSSTR